MKVSIDFEFEDETLSSSKVELWKFLTKYHVKSEDVTWEKDSMKINNFPEDIGKKIFGKGKLTFAFPQVLYNYAKTIMECDPAFITQFFTKYQISCMMIEK